MRSHYSTSEAAARRLGRIIQRIFLPNQEPAFAEPFGNGKSRFPGVLSLLLETFRRADLFSSRPDELTLGLRG